MACGEPSMNPPDNLAGRIEDVGYSEINAALAQITISCATATLTRRMFR